MSPDEKAVWNERVKLTCAAMNNVAVATVVTGVVVPLVSGLAGPTTLANWARAAVTLWWLGVGATIHAGALYLMGRIRV